MWYGSDDLTHLAKNGISEWAFINMVMNLKSHEVFWFVSNYYFLKFVVDFSIQNFKACLIHFPWQIYLHISFSCGTPMRMRLILNVMLTALSAHTQSNTEILMDIELTLSHCKADRCVCLKCRFLWINEF